MTSSVFGPVPSRRLGRSLGVDIVPFKTCTYDCIYCQLGRTTQKTVRRASFAPVPDVMRELKDALNRLPRPDYITISGSGEPTLHSNLGTLVGRIKEVTDIPVAILTNGSLLFKSDVRGACRQADLVLPSLDAGDESMFQYVNRPHESLSLEQVVQGLVQFREEHNKAIWLEVLFLGGVTGMPAEALKIKKHVDRIGPDKIQLNTVVRPPTEEFAFPVGEEELVSLCKLFGERTEVIAPYVDHRRTEEFEARREDVLALVARRPCSINDISRGLMMNNNEVLKCLNDLVSHGLVRHTYQSGDLYYMKG